jgi:hypothetical protein
MRCCQIKLSEKLEWHFAEIICPNNWILTHLLKVIDTVSFACISLLQ